MSTSIRTPLSYMPQLDSLRALAALGVFAQHYLASENPLNRFLPLGDLGVRLFFVLSGYLITAIILQARQDMEAGELPGITVIGHFYIRRFLRLIPVYFLFLVIAFFFIPEVRQYAGWFFTYLQNIHFALAGRFTFANPLWTLAVEEQFYLIWPFLILFWPKSSLTGALVAVIGLGIVSRVVFLSVGLTHFQASMLTPAHFDTLGLGALLAFLRLTNRINQARLNRLLNGALLVGLGILLGVLVAKVFRLPSAFEFIAGEIGAGLLFVWLIGYAACGFQGLLGFFLSQPWLIYLGKISYGMYVYHFYIPTIAETAAPYLGLNLPTWDWARWLIFSLITIGVAACSWYFIERPILGLKQYFTYAQAGRQPSTLSDRALQPNNTQIQT